jgi:hypothetical protein
MKAFKFSVTFADVNTVLKGKGVEEDWSKARMEGGDTGAITYLRIFI